MSLYDKILLRKRAVIEIVNDEMNSICLIWHTRHYPVDNNASNLSARLTIVYNLLSKDLYVNIDFIDISKNID